MTTQYFDNYNHASLFSDDCGQFNLAANVGQTYTVPGVSSKKYRAEFSYNCTSNIFVGLNVTATTPGAGLNTTTAGLEFRPSAKIVKGGDEIDFITGDAAGGYVGVSLVAIPS